MSRTKVLLLFGGQSPEHEVSIRSARNIYQALDSIKYQTSLCYITRGGEWRLIDEWVDGEDLDQTGTLLSAALGKQSFTTVDGSRVVQPDVILPVLHGDNGEDGTVQGLARLMHIPIVGCEVGSSAICWDKVMTKQLLAANDISIVPYIVHRTGEPLPEFGEIESKFGLPLFVKPARSGSSVGVSRVDSIEEYEPAISLAASHDDKTLIEQAVIGRELEVAVMGNPPQHVVSGVGEIKPGEEFYSYDDKYDENSTAEVIVDADLPIDLSKQLQSIAHRTHTVLDCRGLSRVDFLVSDDGRIYVNEVNTFPGFTSISQYPKLWQAAGVGYEQLLESLIDAAISAD